MFSHVCRVSSSALAERTRARSGPLPPLALASVTVAYRYWDLFPVPSANPRADFPAPASLWPRCIGYVLRDPHGKHQLTQITSWPVFVDAFCELTSAVGFEPTACGQPPYHGLQPCVSAENPTKGLALKSSLSASNRAARLHTWLTHAASFSCVGLAEYGTAAHPCTAGSTLATPHK